VLHRIVALLFFRDDNGGIVEAWQDLLYGSFRYRELLDVPEGRPGESSRFAGIAPSSKVIMSCATSVALGGWSQQPKMVLTRPKSASPYTVGIIKVIINEKTPWSDSSQDA
jgi:hypothetical protein